MKIKTAGLIDMALDWAVDQALGATMSTEDWLYRYKFLEGERYSSDWAQGGPIIEREGISTSKLDETLPDAMVPHPACWSGHIDGAFVRYGPTPLIAAMRCRVASKLGDEVDVPEELCHG